MTYDKTAKQFVKWLDSIDNLFQGNFGKGFREFPEIDWYNYFESGYTPEEAFEEYCEGFDETLY